MNDPPSVQFRMFVPSRTVELMSESLPHATCKGEDCLR